MVADETMGAMPASKTLTRAARSCVSMRKKKPNNRAGARMSLTAMAKRNGRVSWEAKRSLSWSPMLSMAAGARLAARYSSGIASHDG